MPTPAAASRHYLRLQRIKAATLLGVRRAWSRMDREARWEQQYEDSVGPQVTALVVAAQIAAAGDSDVYVAEVLNELGFGPATQRGVVLPRALAGVAGDGRPVESLLATTVGRARAVQAELRTQNVADGVTVTRPSTAAIETQALAQAQSFMEMVTESLIADAARAAESVAMAQRPWVAGWVRAINPPCCSRCAILAGRFYLYNEGFARHPRCDCHHIPAPESGPALEALLGAESPERYFESLTEAEQDKIFTRAGAAAIREGADMGRVVNARRGMSTTGETRTQRRLIDGEEFVVNVTRRQRVGTTTTEGTTRRGRLPGQARGARLMPEAILEIAGDDRAEAVRLLRLNGYIL